MKKASEKFYVFFVILSIIFVSCVLGFTVLDKMKTEKKIKALNHGKIEVLEITDKGEIEIKGWHIINQADKMTNRFLIISDNETGTVLHKEPIKSEKRIDIVKQYEGIEDANMNGFHMKIKVNESLYGKKVKFKAVYSGDKEGKKIKKEYAFPKKVLKIPEKEDIDERGTVPVGSTMEFSTNTEGVQRGFKILPLSDDFYFLKMNVSENMKKDDEEIGMYVSKSPVEDKDEPMIEPYSIVRKDNNTAYFVYELEGNTEYYLKTGVGKETFDENIKYNEKVHGSVMFDLFSNQINFTRVTKYMFIPLQEKKENAIKYKLKVPENFPKEKEVLNYKEYDKEIVDIKADGTVEPKKEGRTKVIVKDPFDVLKFVVEVTVTPKDLEINREELTRLMEEGQTDLGQVDKYIQQLVEEAVMKKEEEKQKKEAEVKNKKG